MAFIVIDTDSIHSIKKEMKNRSLIFKKIINKKHTITTIIGLRNEFNAGETQHEELIRYINKHFVKCKFIEIDLKSASVKKEIKKTQAIEGKRKFDDPWFLYKCKYIKELKTGNWILITHEKILPENMKYFYKKKIIKKIGKFVDLNTKKSLNCL